MLAHMVSPPASGTGQAVIGYTIEDDAGFQSIPGSPFNSPGDSPAYCAASSDDAYLFVGHGGDATVRSFAIAGDGALTYTGFTFDVGPQGTIGDILLARHR